MHDASATGWTLTGQWGEQNDFAIAVLAQADNQFEHPAARYLPDWAFDGMVLSFDLAVTNCVPMESDLFPWIDWPYLNVLYVDGTTQQVRLSDHATAAGAYTQGSCTFTLGGSITAGDYIELAWLDQHFNYQVTGSDTLASAANNLAAAITAAAATGGVTATAAGAVITLTWTGIAGAPLLGKGANANRIGVYGTVHGGGTETWSPGAQRFSGGVFPASYSVSLDFSAALTQPTAVQKMWLTFAPDIAGGAAFVGAAWSAAFTSWSVTDAYGRRPLKVAGPGSVRIEETSAWVARTGYWEDAGVQWWSQGFAIRSAWSGAQARQLTIETHCGAAHDIYVGTRLDVNCGQVSATLDGGAPVTLDTYGDGSQVRRRLFTGVSAGQHQVVITLLSTKAALSSGWYFYFDFLECVVPSDVPTASATGVGVACDFDTDNTYKLPPARLLWSIQKSGLVGAVDLYLGVFWWPQRKMLTAASTWAQVSTVTLSGTPTFGGTFGLGLGGTTISHLCLIGDTSATVALALAQLVNQGSTAMWASVSGTVLTLTGLAGSANYHLAVSAPAAAGLTAAVSTVNASAVAVDWGVDDAATSPVNAPVAAWLADWYAGLVAAGMSCVSSFSQELVNPPAAWVQKFHDGTAVATATGFGTLYSSQCTFSAAVAAYMAAAYAQVGGLMAAAGLTPWLQFGEVGWWFNAGGSPASMAYYDADTTAAAATALGRALHVFAGPGDNPAANPADVAFLAGRLAGYVASVQASVAGAVAGVKWELLWPLDVNLPETKPLNWAVNLPAAWQAHSGSGFDSFLCEGFQFGGTDRDLNLAGRCAGYPFLELGWDRASCGYLMGLFNAGWPWVRDYLVGARTRVPMVKIWAWDHVCLYGRMVPVPVESRSLAVSAA